MSTPDIGDAGYRRLSEWHGELTAFRRDLHAHPELGFEEKRTASRVAEALRKRLAFRLEQLAISPNSMSMPLSITCSIRLPLLKASLRTK